MKTALALLIAVHFWTARHVQIPCHPVVTSAPDAVFSKDPYGRPVWMGAVRDGCQVLVSSEGAPYQTQAPMWYCASIVHEVGHLAGLGHTRTGIMRPYLEYADIPYDCLHPRQFRREMH